VPVDDTQVDGTQVHRGQVDDRPSDAASG